MLRLVTLSLVVPAKHSPGHVYSHWPPENAGSSAVAFTLISSHEKGPITNCHLLREPQRSNDSMKGSARPQRPPLVAGGEQGGERWLGKGENKLRIQGEKEEVGLRTAN